MPRENRKGEKDTLKRESTDALRRDGSARSSDELCESRGSEGADMSKPKESANSPEVDEEESMTEAKPFRIGKVEVWEAYKRVKANRGAAGVDEQSLEEFDQDLRGNLYKIWNRMSSGSYLPPAVKRVEIPKKGGGMRPL